MGEEVSIEIETEKSKIDIQNESFEASDGVILKYGDITLRADNMKKLENRNVILASGNVLLTQGTEKVLANEVEFDLDTKKAIIKDSKAYDSNLQLYFGGEETLSEYSSKITPTCMLPQTGRLYSYWGQKPEEYQYREVLSSGDRIGCNVHEPG